MKKSIFLLLAVLFCGIVSISAQEEIPHSVKMLRKGGASRLNIILPQVNGYNCYKGDFHIHTSYSDGCITPAGRVNEAWLDGLDIIAITDHYERRAGEDRFMKVIAPYAEEGQQLVSLSAQKAGSVKADFEAIHNEAVAQVEKIKRPLLLIKGCEMTRSTKTSGHFNCLFLKDINNLYDKDLKVALRNVREQGGFIIHNHPGWNRDTSDKNDFHKEVYKEGLIDGVEVVNGITFYPHIVGRCIDEKLAMFANTDIHAISPYNQLANTRGIYRTMTLVFAKELTQESIREALSKQRTLAYVGGYVIGNEQLLSDFLNESVTCRKIQESKKEGTCRYQLVNNSSIAYTLRYGRKAFKLEPFKPIFIDARDGDKSLVCDVENMYHRGYKHPSITIKIDK